LNHSQHAQILQQTLNEEGVVMVVTRINHFEARAGKGNEVRQFLTAAISSILGSPGCRSCQLLQAIDQPERLAVVEVWDSVEAHQAAAKVIPPTKVQEVLQLLATPPTGSYFRLVGGAD
jgi:quinol monooxygenase YgiN